MAHAPGLAFAFLTAAAFVLPHSALAQCAAPAEDGRWRNLDNGGEPFFIDVKMIGCGDESLNGALPQASHFSMRAWVKQSGGQFYKGPTVNATYRPWNRTKWLYARIPGGGYVDNVWLQAVQRDGKRELHVLIKHESLDSKPSSTSEYWFVH
ncbi:MAG TPA: hypothetical protein VKB79_08515 [Bryobacteraceae bacterium]|nr:hypothetical protein [Bryobacteraceae bacterium]